MAARIDTQNECERCETHFPELMSLNFRCHSAFFSHPRLYSAINTNSIIPCPSFTRERKDFTSDSATAYTHNMLVKLFQLPRSCSFFWLLRALRDESVGAKPFLNQFLRARIKMHTHTHYKVIAIQTHILEKGVPDCELNVAQHHFLPFN